MKCLRKIPLSKVVQPIINDMEQFGFTLVYTSEFIEIWGII